MKKSKFKTIEECKDFIAQSYGYKDFNLMAIRYANEVWDIDPYYNEAAKMFAKQMLVSLRNLTEYNKDHDMILYRYQEAHKLTKELLKLVK